MPAPGPLRLPVWSCSCSPGDGRVGPLCGGHGRFGSRQVEELLQVDLGEGCAEAPRRGAAHRLCLASLLTPDRSSLSPVPAGLGSSQPHPTSPPTPLQEVFCSLFLTATLETIQDYVPGSGSHSTKGIADVLCHRDTIVETVCRPPRGCLWGSAPSCIYGVFAGEIRTS